MYAKPLGLRAPPRKKSRDEDLGTLKRLTPSPKLPVAVKDLEVGMYSNRNIGVSQY